MKKVVGFLRWLPVIFLVLFISCKKDDPASLVQPPPGSWQQTNGPCNGLISALAISGNTVYTGSTAGMHITRDLGNSWSQVSASIPAYATVSAILIHHDTILAATGTLYRSTDEGHTWTELNSPPLYQMKSITWTGNRILVCSETWGELYLSGDNGQTWSKCPAHPPGYNARGATLLGEDIFVATDINGIYKSTDGGQTYALSNTGLSCINVYSLTTAGERLYAGTSDGLFVSDNHGATWSVISNAMFQGHTITRLATDGTTILAGGHTGLFCSPDGGNTWAEAANGLSDHRIESLSFSGSAFLAGTQSGVYRSADGGQHWGAIGIPVTYVWSFSCNGPDLFACASMMSGGIFTTPDNGKNWNFLLGGIPTYAVNMVSWNGTDMLAATDSGVYVSADRGLTWVKKSNGIPPLDEYNTVTCVAGNGNDLYAGTYSSGIYVSHDRGENWSHATLPVNDIYYAMCFFIDGTGIYAGTFCGGVLFSPDHGQTWTSLNNGLPATTANTSIVKTGSQLFLSTFSGVFRSADNGTTWKPGGLSGKVIYGLATNGYDLFAGTAENGVYMSGDQGASWYPVSDGLPSKLRIFCVAVNGSWLYAGTDGQGVWRHQL